MPKITFNNKSYETLEGETVLDCLIRNQVEYPCSCRSGICQSCIAQLTEGSLDPVWQKGLKDTLVTKNYFLACLAEPKKNIAFSLPAINEMSNVAFIKEIKYFCDNVICVHLSVDNLTQWIPGQYVNFINPDNCRRSYSIANIPEKDGYIELHLKLINKGAMSNWIKNDAYIGCKVHLQGPIGDCFYINPNKENFPIVLAGTGTGLAPLLAVALDAISKQHEGNIILIHGGVFSKDLYLDNELQALEKQYKQLSYKTCVLQSDGRHQKNNIDTLLVNTLKENPLAKVYICGPEETTKKLKTTAFLAGIPSSCIYSDTFIYKNEVS